MSDKEKKLKWYTKIAYGFGEVGSQFSWGMISSYLTLFYTDVVGLAPSLISCIMIIARVWDAVNDPMFGQSQKIQIQSGEDFVHTFCLVVQCWLFLIV